MTAFFHFLGLVKFQRGCRIRALSIELESSQSLSRVVYCVKTDYDELLKFGNFPVKWIHLKFINVNILRINKPKIQDRANGFIS